MAGCASAELKGQDCEAGAIGAAVGEVVGDYLVDWETQQALNNDNLHPDDYQRILNLSKLAAGSVAMLLGEDVNSAVNSVGLAVENNVLFKKNESDHLIACVEIFNLSCNLRAGERYATDAEIQQSLIDTAIDLIPLPSSQGVKAIIRGTNKIVAIYKDSRTARQAVNEAQRTRNVNALGYPANSAVTAVQLRTELSFKNAGILSDNGRLTDRAIRESQTIHLSDPIRNPRVVSELTKDGSNIADWDKKTTRTITLPTMQRVQIHYYQNRVTGRVDYNTQDYKVKDIMQWGTEFPPKSN